jgi:hypothetical protein
MKNVKFNLKIDSDKDGEPAIEINGTANLIELVAEIKKLFGK